MQKFGLLSQKLTEISRFKNLVKLRFHVTSVYKNCHNLLNFEATGKLGKVKKFQINIHMYLGTISKRTSGGHSANPPPPPKIGLRGGPSFLGGGGGYRPILGVSITFSIFMGVQTISRGVMKLTKNGQNRQKKTVNSIQLTVVGRVHVQFTNFRRGQEFAPFRCKIEGPP